MTEPRADQIAKLKQSIAGLEDRQRTGGVDLSASILPLREVLAQAGICRDLQPQRRDRRQGRDGHR